MKQRITYMCTAAIIAFTGISAPTIAFAADTPTKTQNVRVIDHDHDHDNDRNRQCRRVYERGHWKWVRTGHHARKIWVRGQWVKTCRGGIHRGHDHR